MTLIEMDRNRSEVTSGRFYSLINDAPNRRTPTSVQNTWELLTAELERLNFE